jgi:single-stranded DNA-binding protein
MNGPNPERKATMSKIEKKFVTVYGNLGQDPRSHQTKEKPREANHYDPILEDVVTTEYLQPSKTFRTFQIAVNRKGYDEPSWVSCIDWTDQTILFRKGDRVRIYGHFQLRTFTDGNGVQQRIQQLVVKDAGIERAKIRKESREAQEEDGYDVHPIEILDQDPGEEPITF